jgi:hypothetical protein
MPFNAVMTADDLKRGSLAKIGWHPCEFVRYEEKPAGTDNSTNVIMTWRILEGPDKGLEFNQLFNEKAMGFGKTLWALWGFPKDSEGNQRVSDEMIKSKLNAKVKIYVVHTENKGKKYNNAEDYIALDAKV